MLLLASPARGAEITGVEGPHEARRGERVELKIAVRGFFENPFDPGQIAVDAEVEGPGGRALLPAFFTREVEETREGNREVLRARGAGWFALRYRPEREGVYRLRVTARDGAGAGEEFFELRVGPGPGAGVVRVDPGDERGMALDDGQRFLAVGANVAWTVEPSGTEDLEKYLEELAAAGLNTTRLWLTHYGEGLALEWTAGHGYYRGPGRYSVEVARRLDRVLSYAEAAGVRVVLVLWQHAQLPTRWWSSWDESPYNLKNGGPAASGEAYFKSAEVARLARQQLRYVAARYGAFSSILAWEIMNEQDEIEAPAALVDAWCEARARELAALDVHRHLITTSHTSPRAQLAAQRSSAYTLAQAHLYGPAAAVPGAAAGLFSLKKPVILGEFSLDTQGQAEAADPAGRYWQEGSARALAAGFQGGALAWWWDRYLRPQGLWSTQTGAAQAAAQVDLRGVHGPLPGGAAAQDEAGAPLPLVGRAGAAAMFAWVGSAGREATLRVPAPGLWNISTYDGATGAGAALGAARGVEVLLPPCEGGCFVELRREGD